MNENLENVPQDIYKFIEEEEINYAKGIDILGWEWSMQEHIKISFFYKHGRLLNGNDDETPVKNIVKIILNMQYWAEDIDVKDIMLFIENEDKRHLSLLVNKYHEEIFLKENNFDTLFDEINQSRIDYGGGLVMDIGKAKPQRMELETIAFCNQSDMLNSPICFKMYFSPNALQEMEKRGWGTKGATHTIDEAIVLSRTQSGNEQSGNIKTPSKDVKKDIEVYLTVGSMPQAYLDDSEKEEYTYQMQVVCFYQGKDIDDKPKKQGITLYSSKCKNPFKLIKRDPVFGRALGYGGAEELFEAQAWTTYNEIQKKEMLTGLSKIVNITDDEDFVKRNHSLKGVENHETLLIGDGKFVKPMDTYPRNIALADRGIDEWMEYAQTIGGAPDPMLGKEAPSGTPFKLQDLVVQTGKSPHEWRVGQYAKFIEEMYRDWFIPFMAREITKGKKFLSSLSLEEMQYVVDHVVAYETNQKIISTALSGKVNDPEEIDIYKQKIRDDFMKDSDKFLEVLVNELKDAKINISVNVAGKQKNISAFVDKLSNLFSKVFSTYNPQTGQFAITQNPGMVKLLNQIIEYSGLSPIDFEGTPQPAEQLAPQAQPQLINNQ